MLAENTVEAEEENLRLDDGCAKAVIGHATIEFQNPMFHFGKWNNREVNASAQGALVQSFHKSGANTLRLANAVPVIVHRSDIDVSSLVKADDVPSKVQPAKWRNPKLPVEIANGRHRHRSHGTYHTGISEEVDRAKRHVDTLTRNKKTPEDDVELEKAVAYRDAREAYLARKSQWLGTFYDYGKVMSPSS